jgi:putative transposase
MTDKPYSTDLKDKEWELIKPLLERKQGRQGQQLYTLRRIVDGCFYACLSG